MQAALRAGLQLQRFAAPRFFVGNAGLDHPTVIRDVFDRTAGCFGWYRNCSYERLVCVAFYEHSQIVDAGLAAIDCGEEIDTAI